MTREIIRTKHEIQAYQYMLTRLLEDQAQEIIKGVYGSSTNKEIEACRDTLNKLITQKIKEAPIDRVIKTVCNYFKIEIREFKSSEIRPNIPLKIAIYILSIHGKSYDVIASLLSISKTTVCHHRTWISRNWNKEYDHHITQIEIYLTQNY